MSDILGFDIDGRPLRAGDEVVVLKARDPRYSHYVGRTVTVDGPARGEGAMRVNVESIPEHRIVRVWSGEVRKAHNDHLPAPQTYEQLIQNLKTGETV